MNEYKILMNSKTPETNDLARGNHVVPTEWAEQLERERDEARHEIEEWRNKWECAITMAAKAEIERDEAREKIERQRERITYLEGATHHACGTPLSKAIKERDEAREELAHIRACVFDVLHCVRSGAFKEMEKAWKEGGK